MCHHAEFGRSALNGVDINIEKKLQNYEGLEPRSLGIEGVGDRKIYATPHMCYHITVGSPAKRTYA